jgi:nitroreductase
VRKPASADAEIHELIRERWSPRAFSGRPVPEAQLKSLIEAVRWAPSSTNEQPWRLIVGDRERDPEGHAHIAATLVPANAAWAPRAPVLMVAVAHETFTRNGTPNRWAAYDTGQAIAQLSLQATAYGLRVHQMGGFSVDAVRERLGVPEGYNPIAVLAVGYPGDPADLDASLRERELAPRQRHPAAEWVHAGAWGTPWSR